MIVILHLNTNQKFKTLQIVIIIMISKSIQKELPSIIKLIRFPINLIKLVINLIKK